MLTMIHFAFCYQRFFHPNISQTLQAKWLKFVVKDRETNDFRTDFQKLQKS